MPRQRGETWGCEEIVHFLNLFGELEVQEQLKSQHRNQAVYEGLARRMNASGYNRTAHQLRIKAKDLKKQYRHMKKNGQPGQGCSSWRYCHLLDSVFCKGYAPRPKAAASPTVKESKRQVEGLQNESQPKSQGRGKPCSSFRAFRRFVDASLGASAACHLIARKLPRRKLQRLAARATANLAKTRSKKCWSMTFSKTLLRCCGNMEKSQQIFQDHMDMLRQEREKMRKEISRSRKEIKAAASQMREVILLQREAFCEVAGAINRYNDLFERFISQRGRETIRDNSVTEGGQQLFVPQFT